VVAAVAVVALVVRRVGAVVAVAVAVVEDVAVAVVALVVVALVVVAAAVVAVVAAGAVATGAIERAARRYAFAEGHPGGALRAFWSTSIGASGRNLARARRTSAVALARRARRV
jgi:hypothetical protein